MFSRLLKLFGIKQKSFPFADFQGLKEGDKFHFIAMGGVGQSALAKILVKLGYEVSGSDIKDSKYLTGLKEAGAAVYIGHKAENLPQSAYVILSSAIKENNPELICARKRNLPVLHRSDMLLGITRNFPLTIGFAGTHGKTTTSGLASYALVKAGESPAYAVGGIIPEINTNADADKNSRIFVAELDESDGTIVKYAPEITVINNLEADHPDFYKNGLEDVLETFKTFVEGLSETSKILVNADDDGVKKLLDRINFKNIVKFSVKTGLSDYVAQNVRFTDSGAAFDLMFCGKILGSIKTSLKGLHNVYNALAVAAALLEAGVPFEKFAKHFEGFSGMGRRFQTVYKTDDIEIIDDYAHHPSEIKATLKAAKAYKEKSEKARTVAIFQPHRYTRFKGLWEEFKIAFDDADVLVVTDVYSAGDEFDEKFNSKNFVKELKLEITNHPRFDALKKVAYVGGKIEEVAQKLSGAFKSGDIILTLGAGDITKLGALLGEKIENKTKGEN